MAEQKHNNVHVEDAVSKSEAFFIKNKKQLIIALIAILVIVGAIIAHKHLYADPREANAQKALFRGQDLFAQDAYVQAINGDSVGYIGFIEIADQYSGTKAANLAKAYTGLSYAKLGEFEKALTYLNDFKGNDQMISASVMGAAGNCYAELGQLDKATDKLMNAADKANSNAISPIFLQQAGEIFVKQGKYADAIKAFTQIKNKYFQSYQAMNIDKYIEQAELLKK